jgi:hypothetical protein
MWAFLHFLIGKGPNIGNLPACGDKHFNFPQFSIAQKNKITTKRYAARYAKRLFFGPKAFSPGVTL